MSKVIPVVPVSASASASAPASAPAQAAAPAPAPASSASPPRVFIDPNPEPTQAGGKGILFDFNSGCRIKVPELKEQDVPWTVTISDARTANVIFSCNSHGGTISTTKKFFVPYRVEIRRGEELVLSHTMDLRGKRVQVQLPVGTLGDVIAWFPYVDALQRKWDCELTCVLGVYAIELLKPCYPNIRFVTQDEGDALQQEFYASYRIGLFFDDWDCIHQPVDFRYVGLHKTAAHILGVEPVEAPPKVHCAQPERQIAEPYVCIAVQSSSKCKYWNNPGGWLEIVAFLKAAGYRVLCIDRDKMHGHERSWTYIPHGVEDFTGPLPLAERVSLLKHADFFVGLSSGLAWLAWASGTPTVMISGFTHPNNEFHTPYRVFNPHTCNSCWNDPKHMWSHYDFHWCPRHKGTDREFECTRLITADFVKNVIAEIPQYQKQLASHHCDVIELPVRSAG